MTMTTIQNQVNDDFPDDAYPLVKDATDPVSARQAYLSTTALLDYLADALGERAFLHTLNLDKGTLDTYAFSEIRKIMIRLAKHRAAILPPRKSKGEPGGGRGAHGGRWESLGE
jgi:hypothetical protein